MGSNQYGYFLSDDEFIAKWRENPSPAALSKVTGVNVRNIMARRRSIEVRYNIKLDTDPNYKLNRNKELAEKAKEDAAAGVRPLAVNNGEMSGSAAAG